MEESCRENAAGRSCWRALFGDIARNGFMILLGYPENLTWVPFILGHLFATIILLLMKK
jgi:hypothetical protein